MISRPWTDSSMSLSWSSWFCSRATTRSSCKMARPLPLKRSENERRGQLKGTIFQHHHFITPGGAIGQNPYRAPTLAPRMRMNQLSSWRAPQTMRKRFRILNWTRQRMSWRKSVPGWPTFSWLNWPLSDKDVRAPRARDTLTPEVLPDVQRLIGSHTLNWGWCFWISLPFQPVMQLFVYFYHQLIIPAHFNRRRWYSS